MNTVLPEIECISEGEDSMSIDVGNGRVNFISNSITSSSLADNTFRGFGSDRYVFKAENKVLTNTEIVEQSASNVNGERINTNSINMTDVFTCYSDGDYTVKIRHIDP